MQQQNCKMYLYQITNDIFTELGEKLQFVWEHKEHNLKKEKQSWGNQSSWLVTKLRSYSHQ